MPAINSSEINAVTTRIFIVVKGAAVFFGIVIVGVRVKGFAVSIGEVLLGAGEVVLISERVGFELGVGELFGVKEGLSDGVVVGGFCEKRIELPEYQTPFILVILL
jgi:hypothetical protein